MTGSELRLERMKLGVYIREVAEYLNVHKRYVMAFESGTVRWPEERIQDYMRYLGILHL